MVAGLYATVPVLEDCWIVIFRDVGRYQMAVDGNDIQDREGWAAVSRDWYSRASEKAPTIGCLFYHLAILSPTNTLQQLCYILKSLYVDAPFASARQSILTFLKPIMSPAKIRQQARAQLWTINTV
jgi:hypothetical protein